MTLFQIIQILKQIALTQPNIKSATDGSIYEVMNTNPSVKYDVVHFSQTTHQSDETTDYYGLNIFYVSRLEDSLEDNRLQIQSIGKEVLDNIIRTFCENWGIDFPVITYTPFTQKFNDLCAGCYCNLRLEIPKEIICADDYVAEVVPGSGIKLQDIGITITQNGLIVVTPDAEYDGIGEIRIQTEVPQSAAVLQDKEVEYTENGSYTVHPDPAYDGLSSVSVDVLVPDNYDKGYDDGKTDGENEQKAKLTVTSFTENNTYTRTDGWSAVTVDVPSDYQDGYDDGAADQKAKLVSTAITENGTYSREDGYSSIEVNVPQTGQTINNQNKSAYIDNNQVELVYTSKTDSYNYHLVGGYLDYTYDSGYTGLNRLRLNVDINASEAIEQGENQQKAKMAATAFTQNGTYTREDGYSAITVNVDDRYDEGYDDGYKAGAAACSGLLATAITLNVASAITDSGTATTTYSPSTAYTDIYYTSSDSTIATIDENTGVITVLKDGTVTICTKDRMSGLQDCKSVSAVKRKIVTGITLNIPDIILETVTATTTVSPTGADTDIYYTSSNPAIATVDSNTGLITAISDGTVTICTNDRISGLQDCKTVTVIGNNSSSWLKVTYNPQYSYNHLVLSNGKGSYDKVTDGNKLVQGNVSAWTFDSTVSGPVTMYFHLTGNTIKAQEFMSNYRIEGTELSRITRVVIPSGVTTIGNESFSRNNYLASVSLPSTITSIGNGAFAYNPSLTSYNIQYLTGLTAIAGNVFNDTAKSTVVIPSNVRSIGEGAFNGAKTNSLTIPASVTEIGDYGISIMSGGAKTITFQGSTPPSFGCCNFTYILSGNYTIYVPANAINAYKTVLPEECAEHITAIP